MLQFYIETRLELFYATEGGGQPLESGHKLSFEFRSVHYFLTVHLVFHKPFLAWRSLPRVIVLQRNKSPSLALTQFVHQDLSIIRCFHLTIDL